VIANINKGMVIMEIPDNIVIGKPIVDLDKLGIRPNENTVFENEEVFIPRILKKYGFFKSTSQVKKNRPDLWREVKDLEMIKLEIGHKRVWLIKSKNEY
jgi:hypothetical protein